MYWRERGEAIVGRIHGIKQIHEYIAAALGTAMEGYGSIFRNYIEPEVRAIYVELQELGTYADLPFEAKKLIKDLKTYRLPERSAVREDLMAIVPLLSFLPAFEYAIKDAVTWIRTTADHSFMHLQRSIAINPDTQSRWIKAYEKGEFYCEALGSHHLLGDRLWTFKASGKCETDLMFYDNPASEEEIEQGASGIIITEWKKISKRDDHNVIARGARVQLKEYSNGLLAHMQLKSTRYVVLVSEDRLINLTQDIEENGITYRHVNIAVRLSAPSIVGQNAKKRKNE